MKVRLELIKHKSLEQINMLKVCNQKIPVPLTLLLFIIISMGQSTSIAMQEEMDQWISNCYNQEIERYHVHRAPFNNNAFHLLLVFWFCYAV